MRELKQGQWLRVAGVKKVLKEDKENALCGTQKGQCSRVNKCGFRHDEDERAKSTPKTAPFSEPPTQRGGSASRKKNLRGPSPSGKFARQQYKDNLKFAPNHLVTVGILPNVNFISLNRVVKSAIGARLCTGSLKVNLAKSRKRMVTIVQWQY